MSSDSTPRTAAGRDLLEWCNRVQYDDRNRDRVLAIETQATSSLIDLVLAAGDEYAARKGPVMPAMERLQRAVSGGHR